MKRKDIGQFRVDPAYSKVTHRNVEVVQQRLVAVSLTSPFDDSDQKRKRQQINDISLPKAVINCNS